MSLNGPVGMYKLKPIYDISETVLLPECMYKMASIYQGGSEMDGGKLAELERNQEIILNRLEELKSHIQQMKTELTGPAEYKEITSSVDACRFEDQEVATIQDAVITASPHHPPLSVWVLYHLLSNSLQVKLTTYRHSTSTDECDLINKLKMEDITGVNNSSNLGITLIWKEVGKDPELMVSPTLQSKITGEVNLARYFARIMKSGYEESDAVTATQIDYWLDMAHLSVFHGSNKERQAVLRSMNACLGKSDYLVGSNLSIADIVLWSALVQSKLTSNLPANVNKWWKMLNNTSAFSMLGDFVLN